MYTPIKKELNLVEKEINTLIINQSRNVLPQLNTFFIRSRGKMLRPAILLLVTRGITKQERKKQNIKEAIYAATAIELFHKASLIHDDIIDKSNKRHNFPTVYKTFGTDKTIVIGDMVLASGFESLSKCNNKQIRINIAQALNEVCEGQLLQMSYRHDPGVIKKTYFKIIEQKTASLFSVAAQAGALCVGGVRYEQNAYQFGKHLGIAFQIIDDLEDILGNAKKIGKPTGQDLRDGEITLPLIYLLKEVSTKEKKLIASTIETGNRKNINQIKKMLLDSQALIKTKLNASMHIQKARNNLTTLPCSQYKKSLETITEMLENKLKVL